MKEDFCIPSNYCGPYTKEQAKALLEEHLEIEGSKGIDTEKQRKPQDKSEKN